MEQPPQKPKKRLAVGRRWTNLSYADFNTRFPRLGAARLARREAKRRTHNIDGDGITGVKIYRYPDRDAPSKRKGAKFSSIMVPMDVYLKLKELSKFYKKSMSQIMREQIEPMFDEAYKQAEVLARIEANRTKDETPDTDKPRRRYNV